MQHDPKYTVINALACFVLNNKIKPEDALVVINPITTIQLFGVEQNINGAEIRRTEWMEVDKFLIAVKERFQLDPG